MTADEEQQLFVEGRNINDADVLAATATELGLAGDVVRRGIGDPERFEVVRAEFSISRSYGTSALPSVLVEQGGERALLAGGYADAPMLESLIRSRL